MMELTDELVTPGCPQCAVKHLSAALALCAMMDGDGARHAGGGDPSLSLDVGATLVARAAVNLVEAVEGYDSHFDFAMGLLCLAEEDLAARGGRGLALAADVRRVRVGAIASRDPAAALAALRGLNCTTAAHREDAHAAEAYRELPSFPWHDALEKAGGAPIHRFYQICISEIRKEYFDCPGAPGKGGEDDMATKVKKAAAEKPAAKTACKGGKCAAKKGCKK